MDEGVPRLEVRRMSCKLLNGRIREHHVVLLEKLDATTPDQGTFSERDVVHRSPSARMVGQKGDDVHAVTTD